MRTLDLFAGIGGFSLAAHWMGWQTAAFVEWDPFCQKVLAKNFNGYLVGQSQRKALNGVNTTGQIPIYGNIKDFHYEQEKERIGPIDLVCGGFPCQPFSTAGKRGGTDDDRYLWPEMLRVIGEVRPTWVVGENVAGLLSMDGGAVFEEVCASLEAQGYAVEAFVLPAISRGAPHRRDRVWIVAYSRSSDAQRTPGGLQGQDGREGIQQEQRVDEFGRASQVHGFTPDANRLNGDNAGYGSGQVPFEQEAEVFGGWLVGVPNKPRLEGHRGHNERSGERVIGTTDSELVTDSESGGWREGQGRAEWPHPDTRESDRGDQWREHWYEAATRLCSVDDGVPGGLVQPVKNRTKILKAAGNAIVPQVVYGIFKAIQVHKDESL